MNWGTLTPSRAIHCSIMLNVSKRFKRTFTANRGSISWVRGFRFAYPSNRFRYSAESEIIVTVFGFMNLLCKCFGEKRGIDE